MTHLEINNDSNQLSNNNPTTQANIDRIRERINALKNSDIIELDLDQQQQIQDQEQPAAASGGMTNAGGAFKLYSVENDNDASTNTKTNADTLKKSSSIKKLGTGNGQQQHESTRSQQSPFISIETTTKNQKHIASASDAITNKKSSSSTRGPIRKYRSGSTSALNVIKGGKNEREAADEDDRKKSATLRQRPATQNDLLYSIESDESTIVDNLISDPQKLKEKLRQSKMEREQLSQLQQNYLRLLEQYAEAENFIDMFRLGGQPLIGLGGASTGGSATANPTPNAKMFQVNLLVSIFPIYYYTYYFH